MIKHQNDSHKLKALFQLGAILYETFDIYKRSTLFETSISKTGKKTYEFVNTNSQLGNINILNKYLLIQSINLDPGS